MRSHKSLPNISLEQWAAFKAVVDEGSYAKAAEALNKSQSTVSYAVARLNELLPTPALVLDGRKAVMTSAGEALYRHATTLLNQAYAMEQVAEYLASGWESSVTLVADSLSPMKTILCALQSFSESSPLTRIKVLETTLSGTDEAVLNRECELAIMPRVPPGFLGQQLMTVKMIPVAHVDHPLAKQENISEAELKSHRQIVVRDTGTKREQNAGWLGSEQRWTVSHFSTTIDTLIAGLGFAFVPEDRAIKLIEQGTLKHLRLAMGDERHIPLSLVIPQAEHAGPATKALAEKLQQSFKRL